MTDDKRTPHSDARRSGTTRSGASRSGVSRSGTGRTGSSHSSSRIGAGYTGTRTGTSGTRRRRKKKSPFKRFLNRHFTLIMVILLALLALFIILIVTKMKSGSGEEKPDSGVTKTTQTPTAKPDSPSPTPDPTNAAEPTATPSPEATPTLEPTPTPYVYGMCSSVTLDTEAEPVEGDNWEIDYLMLVNWSHRLKYTGNPENLVRLQDVLTADFYTIENPYTVAESKRNFVIETEEDKYDRGNRVALEHLNEMCTDFNAKTGIGIKVSQTGAYRNYATQARFWNNRDKSLNPPRTVPGNASEHRTGLGFDIWVLDSGENDTTWFRENCYKYGYILRYPSDKKKITGVAYEQWHFRYVGAEAAKEIFDLGYCLEEYIAYKNGEDLANLPTY